ncbi:ferrous iron transport protein A [Methanothermococcus sp.]|uniref:FeoA family protein n=1 Tax=Methanothermococcus sp. TaxID=2614238 RepID=UPI0025F724FB|nr:ferrous iron transport protein A [Methanothermococcus sp.]
MNLSEVKPGTTVKIKKITGDSNLKTRFLDMGLTKGTYIKVVKKAPLKDPIEVEVRGYSLSLRVNEAKYIEVE